MKMKCLTAVITVSSILMLTGCAENQIPELTEEQISIISEYSTDLVLEGNENSTSRLVDTEAEAKKRAEVAEKAAAVQEIVDAQKKAQQAEKAAAAEKLNNTTVVNDSGEAGTTSTIEELPGFLGLDNVSISYNGYELNSTYPSDSADDWTPAVDASTNKLLLVLEFQVSNLSDSEQFIDILSTNARFTVQADGKKQTALTTMLLNDLAYMSENVAAGSSNEYVLVTQVDNTTSEVGAIMLSVKKDDSTLTFSLQ